MLGWNESPWFAFALSVAFKSTVVLCAAWLVTWILRRRTAAARHLVWTSAALAVVLLPVFTAALPRLDLAGPGSVFDSGTLLFQVTAVATPAAAGATPALTVPAAPTTNPPSRRIGLRGWALLLWAGGILIALLQLATACAAILRARRNSRPFADRDLVAELSWSLGIRRHVEVCETSAFMPVTFGLFRPTVFLPEGVAEWSQERRRMVLLHELAHVRRGDTATHWLARAALMLHWWNPAAWMAWRAFLKERERAADDMVLETGARASDYADELLQVARSIQSGSPVASAAIPMARPSQLEGRLLAILDPAICRSGAPRRLAAFAAAVLAVAVVVPLAAVHAQDPAAQTLPADIDATIRAANAQKNHEILDQAAKAAAAQGKLEIAKKLLDASAAIREQVSGPQSVEYGLGLVKLGELAQRQDNLDEAMSYYTRAIQALGGRPEAAHAMLDAGIVLLSRQDPEGAYGYFQRAEFADPSHAFTPVTWMAIVRARRAETAGEAELLFQRALTLDSIDKVERAATLDLYASLLRRTGRDDEADRLAKQATEIRGGAQAQVTRPRLADGAYHVGNGVTSPIPIYRPQPEYSEIARLAKYQGEVTLSVVIGPDGVPTNIQVIRGLGLGLDEKAVDAVSQWRFKPGTKNGVPVPVQAAISINFGLL